MTNQHAWHSQDAFWELFEPFLFNERRLALAQEQVSKIIRLLPIEEGAQILDLPCGIGRHSLELAARGFEVTGVDRTERYIEAAQLARAQRGLNATFVVGDMREYCAPDQYDVILNLFGSFGYFDDPADNRRVAENMVASLRPGGQLVIETAGKEVVARNFQARDWSEEGDLLVLTERTVSQNWGRIESRWIAIRGTQRIEHRASVRSYSAVELSSLLESCGLSQVRVYGSLDGTPYDQHAERLVVVGRK